MSLQYEPASEPLHISVKQLISSCSRLARQDDVTQRLVDSGLLATTVARYPRYPDY